VQNLFIEIISKLNDSNFDRFLEKYVPLFDWDINSFFRIEFFACNPIPINFKILKMENKKVIK
jgi:hypothetical protein